MQILQDVCEYFRDTSEDLRDGDLSMLFHWMMAGVFGLLIIAFSPILTVFWLIGRTSR